MKFKFKTAAEISALSVEEAEKYHNDMATHLEKSIDDLVKISETTAKKEEISTLKSEISELTKALKEQGEKLAKQNQTEVTVKSTFQMIKDGLVANLDSLKELKAGQRIQVGFEIKEAGTMTFASSVSGELPQFQRLPGMNPIAVRNPFIGQLISSGVATSNTISWVYEVVGVGDADMTAEGVKKNQIDANFAVATESVKKITAFVKVSEEMLEDVDFMASYINNKLLQRINLKVDQQLLAGTGTSQLNGILTRATAYAAGSFSGSVVEPNLKDVIETAINQIIVANHNPNYILLHPTDITKLGLTKDNFRNYIFPEFNLPSGKTIAGIPIVANTGMTEDKFLVMDGTKAIAYYKNGVRIEAGWENDDFTKNLRTILAEVRLCLIIENNDRTAFVYGDVTDAIASLTAPQL
jgi:HK97 family phage major capsid protein